MPAFISPDARPPKDETELRYWLEVMVWYHHYGDEEISAALSIPLEKCQELRARWDISPNPNKRAGRPADAPLLVTPYPGGRHPRIGFLEGALHPQRETKFSAFTPWDDSSYVVVDLPEAIFSNLGLTYLAHEHIPTIWTETGMKLEQLEWTRGPNGHLEIERKLPNGMVFGAKVEPAVSEVRMELWLTNGTDKHLSDLRVQNCVLLKGATGFEKCSNENKLFQSPFAACKSYLGDLWIITAWEHCNRAWGNPQCPCMHSDPKFPDCAPAETHRLHGWLSFYEGSDIQAELKRITELRMEHG